MGFQCFIDVQGFTFGRSEPADAEGAREAEPETALEKGRVMGVVFKRTKTHIKLNGLFFRAGFHQV